MKESYLGCIAMKSVLVLDLLSWNWNEIHEDARQSGKC